MRCSLGALSLAPAVSTSASRLPRRRASDGDTLRNGEMSKAAIFRFRRFDAALGGEIVDLDFTRPLDDQTFTAVRRAFLESEGLLVRMWASFYVVPPEAAKSLVSAVRSLGS
jgi:hypothetical protein